MQHLINKLERILDETITRHLETSGDAFSAAGRNRESETIFNLAQSLCVLEEIKTLREERDLNSSETLDWTDDE